MKNKFVVRVTHFISRNEAIKDYVINQSLAMSSNIREALVMNEPEANRVVENLTVAAAGKSDIYIRRIPVALDKEGKPLPPSR